MATKNKNSDDAQERRWALITKVTEQTGYSDDAIRAKIKRGEWAQGRLWRKAPDHRLVFDLHAINSWMGGVDA